MSAAQVYNLRKKKPPENSTSNSTLVMSQRMGASDDGASDGAIGQRSSAGADEADPMEQTTQQRQTDEPMGAEDEPMGAEDEPMGAKDEPMGAEDEP